MSSRSAPAPRWRRALAFTGRALLVILKVIFVLALVVIPIPIFGPIYRPHRERRNHAALVLRKE